MPAHAIAATGVWLDGDDWSWPGARSEMIELAPPAWIPAVPRPLPEPEAARPDVRPPGAPRGRFPPAPSVVARRFAAVPAGPIPAPRPRRRPARRRLIRQRLLASAALVAVFAATFEIAGRLQSSSPVAAPVRAHAAGSPAAASTTPGTGASAAAAAAGATLTLLRHDSDGASVAEVRYASAALRGPASFLLYLPPGYRADAAVRYPVLYLLHGDGQLAGSFLQFGLSRALDKIIDRGEARPLIAVMLGAAQRTYNWRDVAGMRYEDYVLEVQQLVDRILPTVADRSGRAIAGFSMGGYGAMNIALGHLDRFSVVESWLGFFNGLGGELSADAPRLSRLPLAAFLYGAASDPIADPHQNAPFAAALRGAGASASSDVYSGGHDFATLHAHLVHMLLFAAHSLAPSA